MGGVGKLISLENLLVRKVIKLVLTTTSTTLILSCAFGADWMTMIASIYSRLPRTHSLKLWLTETANTLSLTFWLPAVNPTKMYTFYNLFLSSSAISIKLASTLNTTTEISSNPERDKQPTSEKTHSFKHTLLYFYTSITYMKFLIHIHFIVDRTLSIFCLFPKYPC